VPSGRCSSKRTVPTLWFNASTRSVFSFRVDRTAVCGHLRVWSVSILQEDRPHWRDLYSIAPDATRSVACCYSEPPSGLHHLGSIPRQSQSPRSEPD
jgi:hypothetical protein